jgi:Uma2 family endonuclease
MVEMSTTTEMKQAWDYASYAAIPSDGKRHEILEAEHFVNPAPSIYHQQVSRRLQFDLYQQIELTGLGVVIDAPVDVQLADSTIVQPDLVIVAHSNMHIITPIKIKGIPDLIVEILSPSSLDYDMVKKRAIYERYGVPRYWIVDPDEHLIHDLKLHDRSYKATIETSRISLSLFPSVSVDLSKVW